jgi:CheY-like chemotaxis protein
MSEAARLISPLYREHVMLLCLSQKDCDSAAVGSLNEALGEGQLCIYASILNGDSKHIEMISSGITNYRQNVNDGNLIIIDFMPYFQSALLGNLTPFDQLKEQVESLLKDRIAKGRSDRVMIFAEAAGALSEARQFERSIDLESWWNVTHAEWLSKKLNITIICPHPSKVLHETHARLGLSHTHTLTIELEKLRAKKRTAAIKVLIVEQERDICSIYSKYLNNLGLDSTILQSVAEAEQILFDSNADRFDLVVLDYNPTDRSALGLSKKIWNRYPDQRIIFTTTYSTENIASELKDHGISKAEVFVKPFHMASLISVVESK